MDARTTSVVSHLEESLSLHGSRLRALARRARSGGDEELVHDTRVALRRAEALARLFRGVPGRRDGRALRKACRGLRRRLSLLRSEEVGRALLAARVRPEDGDVVPHVFPGELPRVRVGGPDLAVPLRELAGWRRRLGASLDGAFAPRAAADAALRRSLLRRARRSLARLERLLPPGVATLHEARIAAKRARYVLEAVEPVCPGAKSLVRQLREFQDEAGDAHDLVELGARLRAALARDVPPPAAVARLASRVDAEAVRAVDAACTRGGLMERAVRRLRTALREPETR